MPNYRELRYNYKKDIKEGLCYCILSGLQMNDLRELSLEHFVPLSRGPYYESRQCYNIYPAIKIINGIKGSLLPCEWMERREFLMNKTLNKGHLNKKNEKILRAAIANIPNYDINPCQFCILARGCRDCR